MLNKKLLTLIGIAAIFGILFCINTTWAVVETTKKEGDICAVANNVNNEGTVEKFGTCPQGTQCLSGKAFDGGGGWCEVVFYCRDGKDVYDQATIEKCINMKHADFVKYLEEELQKTKEEREKLEKELGTLTSDDQKKGCDTSKVPSERGVFTKGLSAECLACGICSQKDVFQEIVNIFSFIMQIAGSLAVLIMIVGGIMYMTAAGDQQKTQRAKQALTAAIVGIIIVLTSFLLINFVMTLLGYNNISSWFSPTLQ